MLEEKIGYLNTFPMNVRVMQFINYPLHYHFDVEFIYVLKGFVTLKCGSSIYKMQQGDIFVVNESEVHGIYDCSSDNLVLIIQIDTHHFIKYFPTLSNNVYRTMRKDREDEHVAYLRSGLLNIAYSYFSNSPGYSIENINTMVDIIGFMDKHFNSFYFEGSTVMQKKYERPETNDRLSRIISYIYKYHFNNISLKELAEMEYLSEYYISHLITEGTGLNFREFLAFARVECSEKVLLQSNDKVSSIAKKVGFSTTAYYEKFFKKWYRCSPDEYRRIYASHVKGLAMEKYFEIGEQQALECISKNIRFLASSFKDAAIDNFKFREIEVDVSKDVEVIDLKLNDAFSACENYAWDTIAVIPYMFRQTKEGNSIFGQIELTTNEDLRLVSGRRRLKTPHGFMTPLFYAKQIANQLIDVVYMGEDAVVSKCKIGGCDAVSILVVNSNEEILALFDKPYKMNEIDGIIKAHDVSAIHIIDLTGLEPGTYEIIKREQNYDNSLFAYACMDNWQRSVPQPEEIELIKGAFDSQTSIEHTFIEGEYRIAVNLKGLSYCNCVLIKK